MKVHITKVSATDSKRDGTKLINKFGKPYFRVGVQTTEHGQEWLNGFMPQKPDWEGKEVELDITEEEYNGKTQKKFSLPKTENAQAVAKQGEDIQLILNRITGMKMTLDIILEILKPSPKKDYPINDMDEPFPTEDF